MKKGIMLVVVAALSAVHAEVKVTQNITLNRGWNAIYAEVSPTEPLDEVFADWPVKSVGFYDPASFLATRQFTGIWDMEGLDASAMAMWHRDYPEATNVNSIPAGTVCVAFNTNITKTAVSLTGVPAAPRITWHVTNTNDVYNYIGFSLQHGESILPSAYLEGFEGNKGGVFYSLGGTAADSPKITKIFSSEKVADGQVLLVASDEQSDWPGVLDVSPMNGLDFGSASAKTTLSICNNGANSRTVSVRLMLDNDSWCEAPLERSDIYYRDSADSVSNAAWKCLANLDELFASKTLEPAETWKLEIGLDRKRIDVGVKGRFFGALMRITEDGAAKMRVEVPLVGETSGGTALDKAWPGGLWLANVEFSHLIAPEAKDDTPRNAGGRVKLRLPIHIDSEGNIRLLQRVVAVGDTAPDGSFDYVLYAGKSQIPTTARQVMRVSAVTLPTETPVIPVSGGSLASGEFFFDFTVAADGATSLLRHPLHPQHDGRRWDFKTPTPSGDEFSNYRGDVKPETFSVKNRITLKLNMSGGESAWNPENAKDGICTWQLSGLMRQGPVTLVGQMDIERISPITRIVLE